MRKRTSGSGEICPVIAVQPRSGGMAPDAPPMTMFMGVAGRAAGWGSPHSPGRSPA